MDASTDWVRRTGRRMMVGLHVPDYDQFPAYPQLMREHDLDEILEHIDPKFFVRELRKCHAQAFWFYSKGHQGNAYYPSAVGHMHSALRGRDLFGEFAEACLSEGIVPLCVYEFSDHRMPKDHPDWCHQLPDLRGLDTTDEAQGMRVGGACLNGPYGEFALEQAREVVSAYPVKGYYVDFLGLFGLEDWRCPYCEPLYEEALGRPFRPVSEMDHDEYVAYIRWRYAQNDRYAKRLRKLIKDLRPDVELVHNLHAFQAGPNMQRIGFAAENCDFLSGDLFHLRRGMLQVSWKTRVYGAYSRKGRGEVLLDSVTAYNDFTTTKAPDSYNAEMWTGRSNNCAICGGVIVNLDGTLDKRLFALTKKLFDEQIPYEPWLEDIEPVANVGLVHSHDTLEFRPSIPPKDTLAKTNHHELALEGWVQVLIASHALWTVVPEEMLTDEVLGRLKVLILPDVACMSRTRAAAVRRFVERGGVVVATGDTSRLDEDGHARKDFALGDVFGARFVEDRAFARNQLKVDARLLPRGAPWVSDVVCLRDGQRVVRAHKDARVLGEVYMRPIEVQIINVFVPTDHPGLLENRHGRGRCYYFAGTPGLHYRLVGQDNIRLILSALLDKALGRTPPASLEGPESLELFAHTQMGRGHLVVSLVHALAGTSRSVGAPGYSGCRQAPMRHDEIAEMPRIAQVTLRLRARGRRPVKRVYRAPDRRPLRVRHEGRDAVVTLRDVGVHTMVVVEYGPAARASRKRR